jgi:hypothetical protein
MSAEIEIRRIDPAAFDLHALGAHVGGELAPGTSDTQFLLGTPESGQVLAHVDREHASISFYGSYSQFSEHKLELIDRIAKHLKGQLYIEGEPAADPPRKLAWWQWILWLLAAPFFLVFTLLFLAVLPVLAIIAITRVCLACRRSPPKSQ